MYVCMYVCMYACIHACIYIYIYIYGMKERMKLENGKNYERKNEVYIKVTRV